MSWITSRRRHPAAGYAILLLGLLLVGAIYASVTGGGAPATAAPPAAPNQAQINAGKVVFNEECATCVEACAGASADAPPPESVL